MSSIFKLSFLISAFILSSSPVYGMTPKQAFLKAYQADQKNIVHYATLRHLLYIRNDILDMNAHQKANPFDTIKKSFDQCLKQEAQNPAVLNELTAFLNVYTEKVKATSLNSYSEHQKLWNTLMTAHFTLNIFPQMNTVRTLYLQAADLNRKVDQSHLYPPAEIFGQAADCFLSIDAFKNGTVDPKKFVYAHLAAALSESAYMDVPIDPAMALVWFYRASLFQDKEALAQVALRLSAGVGASLSLRDTHELLDGLVPYASRLPKLVPMVSDAQNLWVFRTALFSTVYSCLVMYLNLIPLDNPSDTFLFYLTGYISYAILAAGITYFGEAYYCFTKSYKPESLEKLWVQTPHPNPLDISAPALNTFIKKILPSLTTETAKTLLNLTANRRSKDVLRAIWQALKQDQIKANHKKK